MLDSGVLMSVLYVFASHAVHCRDAAENDLPGPHTH
jgi:hypothetical protein